MSSKSDSVAEAPTSAAAPDATGEKKPPPPAKGSFEEIRGIAEFLNTKAAKGPLLGGGYGNAFGGQGSTTAAAMAMIAAATKQQQQLQQQQQQQQGATTATVVPNPPSQPSTASHNTSKSNTPAAAATAKLSPEAATALQREQELRQLQDEEQALHLREQQYRYLRRILRMVTLPPCNGRNLNMFRQQAAAVGGVPLPHHLRDPMLNVDDDDDEEDDDDAGAFGLGGGVGSAVRTRRHRLADVEDVAAAARAAAVANRQQHSANPEEVMDFERFLDGDLSSLHTAAAAAGIGVGPGGLPLLPSGLDAAAGAVGVPAAIGRLRRECDSMSLDELTEATCMLLDARQRRWFEARHSGYAITDVAGRGRGLIATMAFPSNALIFRKRPEITVLYTPHVLERCHRCFHKFGAAAPSSNSSNGPSNQRPSAARGGGAKGRVSGTAASPEARDTAGWRGGVMSASFDGHKPGVGAAAGYHHGYTCNRCEHFAVCELCNCAELWDAHQLPCRWFCTLTEDVRKNDTDYLRFLLEYCARVQGGDVTLKERLADLHTNETQQSKHVVNFCDSYSKLVTSNFESLGLTIPQQQLFETLLRMKVNAVGFPFDDTILGWAAQHEVCMMNHSCDQNATLSVGDDGCMELRSLRPIMSGDEITIGYINMTTDETLSDVVARRALLKAEYQFECDCTLCRQQLLELQNQKQQPLQTNNSKGQATEVAVKTDTAADVNKNSNADKTEGEKPASNNNDAGTVKGTQNNKSHVTANNNNAKADHTKNNNKKKKK